MIEPAARKLRFRPNVGLMVMNPEGRVFTGQRLDRVGQDAAWQMPQGGIDEGEDPVTAAYRELEEETGIRSDLVELTAQSNDWIRYTFPEDLAKKLWKGGYDGQKQRWYLMRYLGHDDQINIQTHEPEFAAWKWMPTSELVENIVPFKRSVYEQVLSEFRNHMWD